MERLATTPFGGARFSAANFVRQNQVSYRQEQLRAGDGGNDTGTADKWQLIRALTEARHVYGLSDRSISLLEALLSFHQERQIDGKEPVIVFPSNDELSLRCRGMSEATLRRHLAALVEAGMIFRRDSANGKRYCRRDARGSVEDAFGFDLAPLALRAREIHAHAEAVREENRRISRLRAEITLHSRDIARIIEAAVEEGQPGDWESHIAALAAVSGRLPRNATEASLRERCEHLRNIRATVENTWLESLSEQKMSGNDSVSERHIQNSNTEIPLEIKGMEIPEGRAAYGQDARPPAGTSLHDVLKSCPDIADYAAHGIRSWAQLVATAAIVRPTLGISPDAWREACTVMGEIQAAITLSVILTKSGEIRSAGGYLRELTRKAGEGRFSVHPMLRALAAGRGEPLKRGIRGGAGENHAVPTGPRE